MAQTVKYYRPEWTAGRYNPEKKAAIYYNLVEGMSYFFEDDSAIIIGRILETARNESFTINEIQAIINYPREAIAQFLATLIQLSLLTTECPSKDGIINYRKAQAEYKKTKLRAENKTIQERLPFKKEDAETEYLRKVGGVTQAMLELTYNCSEKCIHCYNSGATRNDAETSHRAMTNELDLDDYKRIIDQLYDEGCFKICLSGGDPFSKPYAWQIIQYIYDKGIAFDIYTNAQGLEGQVERLVNLHPRLMSISLYADNADDHDYITRIPGSWKRTINVINELGNYSVPMDIKVCIMRTNIKAYHGIEEIARNAGGKALYEACVHDSIDGDVCVSKYLRLTPDEYKIIMRDPKIGIYVGEEAPEYGKQTHDKDKSMCDGGQAAICIDPQGNVMPCCAFHLIFGNLKDNSLSHILKQSEVRKRWLNSKLSEAEECLSHEYCDYCIICPGNAYSQHHDWHKAPENCCFIAKLRYDVATGLKNGIDPLNGKTVKECIDSLPDYKPKFLHRVLSNL